jgi:hypothetical protein
VTSGRAGPEIEQDMRHERLSWRIQRAGWAVMGLIVAAALAGVLGSGPLSRSTASAPSGVQLAYERFGRYQDPQTLTLRLPAGLTTGDRLRVSISRAFLDHSKIEAVVPQPEAQDLGDGRIVYVFRVTDRAAPMTVSFVIVPQQIGAQPGVVRVEGPGDGGRAEIRFTRWTYP